MKQKMAAKTNRVRLAAGFGLLEEKDQAYIENLTAQLAKIHETAPETQRLSEGPATGADTVRNEEGVSK
jgi:hypothetical protein